MTTIAEPRTAPNHDTLTCYTDYSCRLPECVARYNARNRERLQARRAGTYNRLVDAEPTRLHIISLRQAGMGCDAIALAAGFTTQVILEFVRPLPSKGRGKRQRTSPATEAKILAVTLDDRTTGRIDATGTRRRIQALATLGWPIRHISVHAGLQAANAHALGDRTRVYVATANAITVTYNQLRNLRPEEHGVTRPHAQRSRNLAARNHWVPPRYWDKHPRDIDNPHYEPMTRAQIIAEEAWFLTGAGLTRGEVAIRLGVSRFYVDRAMRENPEQVAA